MITRLEVYAPITDDESSPVPGPPCVRLHGSDDFMTRQQLSIRTLDDARAVVRALYLAFPETRRTIS